MKQPAIPGILAVLVCAASLVSADVITLSYDFTEPTPVPVDGAYRLEMNDCENMAQAGDPVLPVRGVTILLPPGHEIDNVEVTTGPELELIGSFEIEIAQRQYPISYQGERERTVLAEQLVGSTDPFPPHAVSNDAAHFLAGHGIGTMVLHPVRYVPATGTVSYYPHFDVTVTTTSTEDAQTALESLYRGKESDRIRVEGLVQNPELLLSYPAPIPTRDDEYDLLIIVSDALTHEYDSYIEHKTVRGWKIAKRSVGSVSSYPGDDLQEKIRNCIVDYYTTYGIQYVLLGGDDETVPHRGLWNDPGYGYEDFDIAADLYYAGLDGTWNDDGDSRWGENNEADLVAEVFVARACADNATEAATFTNKSILYENEPVVAECDEALMVGELLWSDPTYAGDYKDEIKYGASTHGYTTVGFPDPERVETLYDRDIAGEWNAMSDLLPLLNGGVHFVNHLGHSDVSYYMRFYTSNITDANFTNNGVNHSLYITYSQGCYCGSFDNRTTGGGYTSDCINERISIEISNGAVATVSCSRYGWGAHSSTNGSSQYYDREFFDAIFGEGITNIAWANQDSKEDVIWAINYNQNRWCYYELNVLGDPLLDMWTAVPTDMVVNYPAAYLIGEPSFTVTVSGVVGARVGLSRDGELLGRGFTDGSGVAIVTLDNPPQTPGTMDIVVTAHDRLPFQGTVNVASPTGPYVVCVNHTIDDDMNGSSWGDGDGEAELGETIELAAQLENVGTEQANGVSATFSCSEQYVQFTQATQYYGDMAAGAQVWSPGDYVFSVVQNCPDQTGVTLQVGSTDGSESWDSYVSLMLYAPVLYLDGVQFTEVSGNGNGKADPGETIAITPTVGNSGHGTAWSVNSSLNTTDSYTTINTGAAGFPDIEPQTTADAATPYQVSFSSGTPLGHLVDFTVDLVSSGGYTAAVSFTLCVGKKPLLVVDTDNETTETRILNALANLGEQYDLWQWYTAGSPGIDELRRYECVIWASGDQNASTGTAQDRSDLGTWLDEGGALLFSAENYLTSYDNESFTTDYLHIASFQTNVTVFSNVVGEPGDPIGDGLDVGISYHADLAETPDTVEPDGQTAVVFRSGSANQSTVIRYPASGDGPYKVIFFGTPLEAFATTGTGENTIEGVIVRCLAWMRGGDDLQPPSSPTWAGIDDGGILIWDPASDNVGVTGYRLYRDTVPHFSIVGMTPWAYPTEASWDVSDCLGDVGANYCFIVTAVDAADNESAPSPSVGEHDFELLE